MGQKKRAIKNPSPATPASTSRPKKKVRSRPAEEQPPPPRAPGRRSDTEWSRNRRLKLDGMAFGNTQHLNWGLLREYGMEEQIRERLSVAPWIKLFEINEPAYREVTLEVLSTLKWTEGWFTFEAYGKCHILDPKSLSLYLGLETVEENRETQYREKDFSWPKDMSSQLFWEQLIGAPRREKGDKPLPQHKYDPSHSKASKMNDMELRIIHHLMAHTIGQRKSSHGIVNSFEISYLYSLVNRKWIDLGYQVAKYLFRQVEDPRAKGIYCGGYITRLLKGLKVFQPLESDPGKPSTRISNGPFSGWGLVKVIDGPSRYTSPPRSTPPSFAPSTSQVPLQESELQRLTRVVEEERRLNHMERRKNKRFRSAVWTFLTRLAGCFSPPPADLPTYSSSPEVTPPPQDVPSTSKQAGKRPLTAESSSSEEEDDESGEESAEGGDEDDEEEPDEEEGDDQEADDSDDEDDD